MKKQAKNIQTILSKYFLFVMLTLLLISTLFVTLEQYIYRRSNTERDIQRTCTSISSNVDMQISQMDAICLNVIHSVPVKTALSSYLDQPSTDTYNKMILSRQLNNDLIALKGVDSSILQVNLYQCH